MRLFHRGSVLGLLLLAAAASGLSQVNNPKNLDPSPHPRGSEAPSAVYGIGASSYSYGGPVHPELYRLWKGLQGRYEKSDEGSRLTVTLTATSPYVLSVQARTVAGGHESVERGWIYLGDASTGYTSAKMRFALSYRPDSLRSNYACTLYGSPSPDGIAFESEASDCSFPLGRRISKMRVDATRSAISVSNQKDTDMTVLTRISAN